MTLAKETAATFFPQKPSFLLHPLCNSFFGWACGWVRLGLMPLLLLLAHARRLIYRSAGTLQSCTFLVLGIPLLIFSILKTFPWGCTGVFLETILRTWQNPLSNLLEQRMTGADWTTKDTEQQSFCPLHYMLFVICSSAWCFCVCVCLYVCVFVCLCVCVCVCVQNGVHVYLIYWLAAQHS